MIDGALKADGRLAAKNAVKIRAALHQVTDFKRVFDKYQETQPQPTDNPTQDRTRARSWIILNVYLNDEPLRQTVMRAWAEAYVLGQAAAGEWIAKTERANKADDIEVNWDNWKPGDKATALLLNPTKGFEAYLQSTGGASYFKKFNKETIVNLGTALSDSIALGLDAESAAVMIGQHVASPSRALTIAITEQNRAMSFGSIQRYKEAGLQKMEWAVSDPCDICAKNDGQVIVIGQTFASGDQQPPAHPHCRCVLLPVIPGMEDEPEMPGVSIITPPAPVLEPAFGPPTPVSLMSDQELQPSTDLRARNLYRDLDDREFKPGEWQILPRDLVREAAIENLRRAYINPISREKAERLLGPGLVKRADKSLLDKGVVYKNGKIEVQFSYQGLKTTEAERQLVLKEVEKLQINNPKERAVVHIEKESKSKYGWAYGGKSDLWVTPETVRNPLYGAAERGKFKMPVTPTTTQLEYTLTHEWGHLIDDIGQYGTQSAERTNAILRLKKQFPDAFKSQYSSKNTKEFYAEMFTEYVRTGGATPNELVQAMAKEFGWKVPVIQTPVKTVAFATNPAKVKELEAWDKSKIVQISKIKDPPSAPTKIWQGSTNEYITTYRPVGGDPRLKALLDAQGFTAKPTVVSAAEFETLVQKGGVKVYRGVIGDDRLTAEQMVEMFKTGDMYVGTGVIGNGVYSGVNYEFVLKYAMDKPGNVLEMVLSPTAKFMEHDVAEKGAKALSTAFYDKAFGRSYSDPVMGQLVDTYVEAMGGIPTDNWKAIAFRDELRELGWTFKDPGAYAAANGYDAIRYSDLADNGKDAMYVILNRGAVVVKE
jgi:SPP1 gp7 family putative phage head morphogenesis protein